MINTYNKLRTSVTGVGTSYVDLNPIGAVSYSSSAEAYEVVSSSANDISTGTGIRRVTVIGIGAAFGEQIVQTVQMNGTTPVALPTNLLRAIKLEGIGWGSLGSAAGTVDVRRVSGGAVQRRIPIAQLIDHHTQFTVPGDSTSTTPSDAKLIIRRLVVGASALSRIQVAIRRVGASVFSPVNEFFIPIGTTSIDNVAVAVPYGADVSIQGRAETGTSNISVEVYTELKR